MSAADTNRLLRRLPSVDDVLRSDAARVLLHRFPRWAVVGAARNEIEARRARLLAGAPAEADVTAAVCEALEARLDRLSRPSLRRVLNATGVVLHTNLGRAPLSARAIERIGEVARGYSTLEYDPGRRARGSRHEHLRAHLVALTGAEAALVVNNNAGAVLLALAALAAGREVVVSRGELVEIGGGFRVPDVMRASGATLVEVGTTNRTRLADYTGAVGPATALLLKVHRSNFAMVGFTEESAVRELAGAARGLGLPMMVDLGSGALIDPGAFGLPSEPTVDAAVRDGADLVTFSGDKLLGGPQAGVIVGRAELVDRIARHPLARALRPDKLTLAALEATLESYRAGTAVEELPALRHLAVSQGELAARKDRLMAALRAATPSLDLEARRVRSAVGGGALPLAEPDSWAVAVRHETLGADALAGRLAAGDPPVVACIADDTLLLDIRTVAGDEVADLAAAVAAAARDEEAAS